MGDGGPPVRRDRVGPRCPGARYGEDAVFIGPPRAQAVTDIFEWPELLAVTDLASARQAIETIVEQARGARGWLSPFGTSWIRDP